MSRKIVLLGVLSLVSLCGNAFAKDPERVEFSRQARVSIGADGKVTALEFTDCKGKSDHDLVGSRLGPVIRSWAFEPGSINGQRIPTETGLNVNLEALPNSDGSYAIRVLNASTGGISACNMPPEYPMQEMHDGAEANITLLVTYDETGVTTDVSVQDAAIYGSRLNKAHFIEAAIKAAKQWRFRAEKVGDHAIAAQIRVPVSFCLGSSTRDCSRFAKERAVKGDTATANTPVALDSKVKLVTQVAGTTF